MHDDDVTWRQLEQQNLFDVGEEMFIIHWTIEHHQVDPGSLELADPLAPNWLGTPAYSTRSAIAGKKPLFQNRISKIGWQRPSQARDLRPPQIIPDRAASNIQHAPDLPGADPFAG